MQIIKIFLYVKFLLKIQIIKIIRFIFALSNYNNMKQLAKDLIMYLEQNVLDTERENDTMIDIEFGSKLYRLDYSANIHWIEGCKSNDYDVPNDPDTSEVSFNWIEVKEIYNKEGIEYTNCINKFNKLINKEL